MANMVGLPGDNINSYYRTLVTKNCCAPGRIDWAPEHKYFDTPVSSTKTILFTGNSLGITGV